MMWLELLSNSVLLLVLLAFMDHVCLCIMCALTDLSLGPSCCEAIVRNTEPRRVK